MILLFKKLKTIQIITLCITCVVFLALTFHFINSEQDTIITNLLLIIYAVLLFFIALIFEKTAAKKHDKILFKLTEQCDPYDFLNSYIGFAKINMPPVTKTGILVNLATGYINADDYIQAKAVLADARKFSKKNPINLISCHLTQVSVSYHDNDISTAQQSLAAAKAIIDTSYLTKSVKNQLLNNYNIYAAELNIYNNCLDGTESLLLDSFQNAQTMLNRVCIQFCLYELYTKQNRTEEARQALIYVAEHGNKLAIAKEARQLLSN